MYQQFGNSSLPTNQATGLQTLKLIYKRKQLNDLEKEEEQTKMSHCKYGNLITIWYSLLVDLYKSSIILMNLIINSMFKHKNKTHNKINSLTKTTTTATTPQQELK